MFDIGDFVHLKINNITILEGEIVHLTDEYVIIHPKKEYCKHYLSAKLIRKEEKTRILRKDRNVITVKNTYVEKYINEQKNKQKTNNSKILDSAIHHWDFAEHKKSEKEIIDDFNSEKPNFEEFETNEWYKIESDGKNITISGN